GPRGGMAVWPAGHGPGRGDHPAQRHRLRTLWLLPGTARRLPAPAGPAGPVRGGTHRAVLSTEKPRLSAGTFCPAVPGGAFGGAAAGRDRAAGGGDPPQGPGRRAGGTGALSGGGGGYGASLPGHGLLCAALPV